MQQIYEFDTSNINPLTTSDDLYQGRSNMAAISDNGMDSDVTVCVQGYNRVEKSKQCVESILKYTGDVNYDLLLIDNGSTDGTFDFFKSVDFKKKRIIRIDKNVSAIYPTLVYNTSFLSRYMAGVSNDLVVTPHWLSNLLRIAESDEKIGLVQPVSSNVSNSQQVNLNFNSLVEMEEKAKDYNVSNPAKWEQRLRLVINGCLIKKEALFAIGWPFMDVGFYHDFADDDMTFRVRRAGYKAILARDTWICHDHDHTHMSSSDIEKGNRSIKIGRENFRNKYFGIDAWDDVNCFIPEYLSALKPTGTEHNRILGIDVRCGTPILEIKNRLRYSGIYDAECHAFTQQAKYFLDLQTFCGADNVFSGDIGSLVNCFDDVSFDYIVIGEDINSYKNPIGVIKSALKLLAHGGQLFVSLSNSYDLLAFLKEIRKLGSGPSKHVLSYTMDEFVNELKYEGINAKYITSRGYEQMSQDVIQFAQNCMNKLGISDEQALIGLLCDRHFFVIDKE